MSAPNPWLQEPYARIFPRLAWEALRADEVGHEARQHFRRVFPPDQLEQLEGFVGEVERVPLTPVTVIATGREHHVSDLRGRQTDVDCRAQAALRRLRRARLDEAAEPLAIHGRPAPPVVSGARSKLGGSPATSPATCRMPWCSARGRFSGSRSGCTFPIAVSIESPELQPAARLRTPKSAACSSTRGSAPSSCSPITALASTSLMFCSSASVSLRTQCSRRSPSRGVGSSQIVVRFGFLVLRR